MTVTTARRPRIEFLFDVFVTAVEGGINYWARIKDYHWMLPDGQKNEGYSGPVDACADFNGFYATVSSSEYEEGDDDNGWGVRKPDGTPFDRELRIDAEVIRRGVGLFVRYCNGKIDYNGNVVPTDDAKPLREGHYWHQFLEAERTNGADGDYDAEVAEQIVQFGLLGAAIYG